jgi:hypothetical protein
VTNSAAVIAAGGYVAGGTDVAIADGGTASSTVSGAQQNLEVEVGVDVRSFSDGLNDISGLSPDQYDVMEWTGSAWAAKDGKIPVETVLVRSATDLSGSLDSTKAYLLDGVIDMGSQSITVPPDGLEIRGDGLNVSVLKSTANGYTMFVDASGDAGTLNLSDLTLTCSGTTSKIFDLDNASATAPSAGRVELTHVNYTDVTEIGDLSNYTQLLQMTCVWRNVSDGYTLHGTWSGALFIDSFLVRGFGGAGKVMFREGTSLTFGSRLFCNGNIEVPTDAIAFNFSNSVFNDASFELVFGNYSGAGAVSSVILPGDVEARFRDNNGTDNTYVGGRWTSVVIEALAATSTFQTILTTAADTTPTDLQWMSVGDSNDLTYDSTNSIKSEIKGSVTVSASENTREAFLRVVKFASAAPSTPIVLATMPVVDLRTSGNALSVPFQAYGDLDLGDVVSLQAASGATSTTLTFPINANLAITERAN